ncbi:MAG: hypothetical protein NTU53_04335 [Planctomycetota bacterium]|nr:hypothetical protein [Planctomycetota bacterium]
MAFRVLLAVVLLLGAARQSQAQWSFSWLGRVPGDDASFPYAVSAHGPAIVGESICGDYHNDQHREAFRWTPSHGMVGLGYLAGLDHSWADGVSADGSVVVGFSGGRGEWPGRAFRWTQSGGMLDLGWPAEPAWAGRPNRPAESGARPQPSRPMVRSSSVSGGDTCRRPQSEPSRC